MSKLIERLKELMEEQNFTPKKMAELLGVSHSNMNRFLRGERTPNFRTFVNILYIFNCSAEYLLGKTDLPVSEPLHPVLPFHERLRAVMQEFGVSQTRMIREMPLSANALYKWLSGRAQPTPDSLIRLAKYLDCSIDYLIGRIR